MKTLANCNPTEFLKQTSKIRKSVGKWLTDTGILEIRKRRPEGFEEMNEEQKREAMEEQAKKNLVSMLDVCLDDYPDETLELLALLCFVEPDHIDDYKVKDFLRAFTEIINDEDVIGFFTSLMQLENRFSYDTYRTSISKCST